MVLQERVQAFTLPRYRRSMGNPMREVQMAYEVFHPICLEALIDFMNGDSPAQYAAWVCNMVDSRNIPLTEFLISYDFQ